MQNPLRGNKNSGTYYFDCNSYRECSLIQMIISTLQRPTTKHILLGTYGLNQDLSMFTTYSSTVFPLKYSVRQTRKRLNNMPLLPLELSIICSKSLLVDDSMRYNRFLHTEIGWSLSVHPGHPDNIGDKQR